MSAFETRATPMPGLRQTGVEWIDQEHAMIRALFEDVKRAIGTGNWRLAKARHKTLVKSAEEHFQKEEALMAAYAYPRTAEHEALHERLLFDLTMLYAYLREGAASDGLRHLLHDLEKRGLALVDDDCDVVAFVTRMGFRE